MSALFDRAWMTTATTGTGTITLGSALSGYQTFAAAGVTNGTTVHYVITDGANWEIGNGTYTSSGTTLSRSVIASSNSGSAISLSGNATVFIDARASDLTSAVAITGGTISGLSSLSTANNTLDDGSGNATVKGLVGTTTNNNASAGNVGEYVSASVASGSALSLTTATAKNVTSISLTAGDWDVCGNVGFVITGTACQQIVGWISSTSATVPTPPNNGGEINIQTGSYWLTSLIPVSTQRFSLSTTTTIYLEAYAAFSSGTVAAYGFIGARRVR